MPAAAIHVRALLLIPALALVGAACGGNSASSDGVASLEDATETTSASATDSDEVDVEQALLDFAACMRDNGVDIEDPTVDADGNVELGAVRGQVAEEDLAIDREMIRAAREECGSFLEGTTLGFRRGDNAELQDTLFEYAQCMRDNGVEMDDPDFSEFGPGGTAGDEGEPGVRVGPFGVIDADDPHFEAAQEACGDILGGFGPRAGGGRPPSDGS